MPRPSQQSMRNSTSRMPPPARPGDTPERRGVAIATNMGQGLLRPGAGPQARREGVPLRCGSITGRAYGYVAHPNARDAARTSYRFVGDFILVKFDGTVLRGAECYLPSTIERTAKAILDLAGNANSDLKPMVPISVDVWVEPDDPDGKQSPIGYRYVCYNLMPVEDNDPLLTMAYMSGTLERPTPQITQSVDAGEVDPETGEIMPVTERDAA